MMDKPKPSLRVALCVKGKEVSLQEYLAADKKDRATVRTFTKSFSDAKLLELVQ